MYQVPAAQPASSRRWYHYLVLLVGVGLMAWSSSRPWDTGRIVVGTDGTLVPLRSIGMDRLIVQGFLLAATLIAGLWIGTLGNQRWATTLLRWSLPVLLVLTIPGSRVLWRQPGENLDNVLLLLGGWVLLLRAVALHTRSVRSNQLA